MHLRPELQIARGRHAGRVGVDRFALREVHDRRERLGSPRRREARDPPSSPRSPRRCPTRRRRRSPRSRTAGRGLRARPRKPGSARIACTARAPVSDENLRSGIPVRSPTIRTPGTAVVPSSRTSGSFRRCRPATSCGATACTGHGAFIGLRRVPRFATGLLSFDAVPELPDILAYLTALEPRVVGQAARVGAAREPVSPALGRAAARGGRGPPGRRRSGGSASGSSSSSRAISSWCCT